MAMADRPQFASLLQGMHWFIAIMLAVLVEHFVFRLI
jgi:hypothetical protein